MKLLFSFIGVLGVSLSANNAPLKAINVIPGGQNIGIEIKPGGLLYLAHIILNMKEKLIILVIIAISLKAISSLKLMIFKSKVLMTF